MLSRSKDVSMTLGNIRESEDITSPINETKAGYQRDYQDIIYDANDRMEGGAKDWEL